MILVLRCPAKHEMTQVIDGLPDKADPNQTTRY